MYRRQLKLSVWPFIPRLLPGRISERNVILLWASPIARVGTVERRAFKARRMKLNQLQFFCIARGPATILLEDIFTYKKLLLYFLHYSYTGYIIYGPELLYAKFV